MEFGATYPTDCDTLYSVDLKVLKKARGSFGANLSEGTFVDLLSKLPSHARYPKGAFPRWKQLFIQQNRELYLKHEKWLKKWLPSVQQFPSSYQKCEWNCQGEERDIWKYVIQFRASGVRIKRPSTAPSLVAMTTTQVPIIAWEKRYMTVRECARLQSMGGLKFLPNDTAAFKALGNAVNVTVVQKVLSRLLASPISGKFKRDTAPSLAA
ncbi:MAG: DNA cytosine methyltransferase [Chthoniobacteraceae bacterium]